ncbi:MAG: hypothetical protein ACNYPE_14380 [Candidatus Azotimanducaceae bacterium WSBS_2022_MAG_OTU7]
MNIEDRVDAAIDRIQKMSKEEFKAQFEESGSSTTISISTILPETKSILLSPRKIKGFTMTLGWLEFHQSSDYVVDDDTRSVEAA